MLTMADDVRALQDEGYALLHNYVVSSESNQGREKWGRAHDLAGGQDALAPTGRRAVVAIVASPLDLSPVSEFSLHRGE